MDKFDNEDFIQVPKPPNRSQPSSSQKSEAEIKGCAAVRKSLKADREKLRRDRLNEHFIKLGNVLDPERPKNDKATILTDTIQLLKDLTSQVNKLKSEYSMLTEESRELTEEKNDLREEKASLKSEIDNLTAQYQQRSRTMYPWAVDHSVMMGPPSYPYPVPMPMPPPGPPIPMHHPHLQPYPFYGGQNPPGVIPNPCSTFVPYMAPPGAIVDQQSQQYVSTIMQPVIRPNTLRNKSSSGESKAEKSEGSNDVATDLELKTPGSATDQDISSGQGQSQNSTRNEKGVVDVSSSSRCSSSRSVQDSSSNSVISSSKAKD